MSIVCWQTILMIYRTLFLLKIRKDVAKFAVCCSRDWHFKGFKGPFICLLATSSAADDSCSNKHIFSEFL